MLTEAETYAYLAGIIDGEGSIGIDRQIKQGRTVFRGRMQCNMTDPRPISMLKDVLGGTVTMQAPHGLGKKWFYHWSSMVVTLDVHLPRLLPYLTVKREQAELLLKFRKLKKQSLHRRKTEGRKGRIGAPRLPESYLDECDEMYLHSLQINSGKKKPTWREAAKC